MVNCFDEQEQDPGLPDTEGFSEIHIHWDDGITQLGCRVEGNNLILYEITNYGLEMA